MNSFLIKFIPITLLFITLMPNSVSAQRKKEKFKVMIDAGHGGYDSGTRGTGKSKVFEKDIALSVALKFGKKIKANMPNVEVLYTRKTDVFIKLKDRAVMANKSNADLFISIHCNANARTSASGTETFVLGTHKNKANFEVAKKENSVIFLEKDNTLSYEGFDPNDQSPQAMIALTLGQEEYLEQSLLLASLVQDNYSKNTKMKDRNIKQAGFWVLAQTSMPSILTEIGFLSNYKDSKILLSNYGQNKIAKSLFDAFKDYKIVWDKYNKADEEINDVVNLVGKKDVKFAVQILASGKKLDYTSTYFKGLNELDIDYYKHGNIYRYIYFITADHKTALKKRKEVLSKGFKGAFVIALSEGKRIDLGNALKVVKSK
ncbi:MAG: N-acetylmuramoyl-L-alanine amidase [Ichthyobacteriaceae bacterium]|nr:N-acetylmuramoyl-L-alanine amidase [Ichthyobacteriaceae bacterium]